MKDIERFIEGFRAFQNNYFESDDTSFLRLKHGQTPKSMIIGCSDSRVDPAILTNCAPGEIFIVRNVANLVPPLEKGGGQHGVSAAIEFAVCNLKVEHIIILGHSQCGGIKALMSHEKGESETGFLSRWMSIAAPAREQVLSALPDIEPEKQQRAAEQAAIILSMENLSTFPFVAERIKSRDLSLHGWYFDLNSGKLYEYRPKEGKFRVIE